MDAPPLFDSTCNESEQFAREQLEAVTAAIIHHIGFAAASDQSFNILSDILRRYIQTMCTTLRWVSEHCGRSKVTAGDVEYTYRRMHVNIDEMNDYFKQNRPNAPIRPLPRFPVASGAALRQRVVAQPLAPPPHIPSWTPPICALWMRERLKLFPREHKQPKEIASSDFSAPPLPDFSNQTAVSLGLCRGMMTSQPMAPVQSTRRPSYHPSRPSSSNALSRPPSRPISRMGSVVKEEPKTEPMEVDNGPLFVETAESRGAVPMFKRRLAKRKSQDDLASPTCPSVSTPSPATVVPQSELSRMRQAANTSVSDLLELATPTNQATPTRAQGGGEKSRSGSVLTLASDLARDPGWVVSAALGGRSAPCPSIPSPARPIPRNSGNLDEEPGTDEQPNRIVQMAILRHLFTLESDLGEQMQRAFAHVAGERNLAPPPSIAEEIEEAPPTQYSIVKTEQPATTGAPMRVLPPLKIRISRGGGVASTDPSPVDSVGTGASRSTDEEDEMMMMQRRKRHHKKKKKRKRELERADDEERMMTSPCEVSTSGIRLKIRLGPPSRPASGAS